MMAEPIIMPASQLPLGRAGGVASGTFSRRIRNTS
jgi:hypothetical protein